jgi:hypothetical protein
MATTSRARVLARDKALIAGVEKHFGEGSVRIDGRTYTHAQLLKVLQRRVDATNAITAARAALATAILDEERERATTKAVVDGIRQLAFVMFGSAADGLADFGLSPRRRTHLTGEQLAARTAKAAATRKARGTLGPKQRLRIKGTVPEPAPSAEMVSAAQVSGVSTATATVRLPGVAHPGGHADDRMPRGP